MPEPLGSIPIPTEDTLRAVLSDPSGFSLAAQPIVDLRNGTIVGYEALARFKLDVATPPDVVFASAASLGFGAELEARVVQRALQIAKTVPPNCFLAINVDPEHLTSPRVLEAILSHGDLGGLVFELTEQRRITDVRAVANSLNELRERGAFTAVDDAGAGYAGLQQILTLRPQFLKVDRVIVAGVHADEAKRAMIEMLGELAERLDAWIIAEGVEDKAELHALAQLGVPLAQGYCLGWPAAPWPRLAPDIERTLDVLPRQKRSSDRVEPLVEPCATCELAAEWPEGAAVSIRVEGTTRPHSMRIVDENGAHVRAAHELLRVKRSSSISAVALRSVARPERMRWDPIVCVDDLGHFEGIIHVHRLVWELASRDVAKLNPVPTEVTSVTRTVDKRQ
jgi:EAL domain-containing protein (putative c-di-GMP-specific phosphodiesterase class I)